MGNGAGWKLPEFWIGDMTMEMGHARVMPDEHEMFDMSRRRFDGFQQG